MLERLALMNGALTTRITAEAQQSQQSNGAVSGVPVGNQAGSGTGGSPSTVPFPSGRGDVETVESTGAALTGHPAFAGLVEYVKV